MKIDFLEVRSRFKNLDSVRIDFDEDNLMTVIVGRNGSGKSNVLEALVAIFRNLDLGEDPPFSYVIRYKLGSGKDERWVHIDADPKRPISSQYEALWTKGSAEGSPKHKISRAQLKRPRTGQSKFLPKYLFAYYSGPSDRLEEHFRRHRTDFYRRLLQEKVDLEGDIRPLFYAKPIHSQFVLLAFFLASKTQLEQQFLRDQLGITDLDSVHFVMRKPDWTRQEDERFWGAGGVVREFLDRLYPYALAPLRLVRTEDTSLTGKRVKNEFVHLFLPDLASLKNFAQGLSADIFFKMLESTLLSEIISEVRVTVKVEKTDEPLSFRELSEGEQQLLTVLGLLKFTGGADSLFLLDEPDTHLNPAWSVKYLRFLRDFVPDQSTSHVLMVSHHPLAIAELEKEQIQVMWTDDVGQVYSTEPAESPRGMGYSGILTSDMFGLRTTLDEPTEMLVRARRELTELSYLNPDQKESLKITDQKLAALGFSSRHWDEDYQQYLRLRKEILDDANMPENDSPEAQKRRREIAVEAMKKLREKNRNTGADETRKI